VKMNKGNRKKLKIGQTAGSRVSRNEVLNGQMK
jgi:hypothetical protein